MQLLQKLQVGQVATALSVLDKYQTPKISSTSTPLSTPQRINHQRYLQRPHTVGVPSSAKRKLVSERGVINTFTFDQAHVSKPSESTTLPWDNFNRSSMEDDSKTFELPKSADLETSEKRRKLFIENSESKKEVVLTVKKKIPPPLNIQNNKDVSINLKFLDTFFWNYFLEPCRKCC